MAPSNIETLTSVPVPSSIIALQQQLVAAKIKLESLLHKKLAEAKAKQVQGTTNTPGSLANLAPVVAVTRTPQSEPSLILTEGPSTSTTAATTITQPDPPKNVEEPLPCTTSEISTIPPVPLGAVAPLCTVLAGNIDLEIIDPQNSLVKDVGSQSNSLIAENQTDTVADEPYRYAHVMPLDPGDVLGMYHCQLLSHYMDKFFQIDKNSEAMCPGDPHYDVYVRIYTFDYDAKNAITEFNALMDVVYEPDEITDNQESGTTRIEDDKTEDVARDDEKDVGRDDDDSPSLLRMNDTQVQRSLSIVVYQAWSVSCCVIKIIISFIK